jgi:hypothetical protein
VRSTTFVFKELCTCIQKMEFFNFKSEYTVTVLAGASPRALARSVSRPCRAPLGVCARGHQRPREPAVPGRATSPGRRHSRDASIAPRHAPPHHCVVRAPAEERRSTVASRPSSSRRHRRSISRPIKGRSPPPRARTAAPPRRHARRLGELSLRLSTELCTHTYTFLVTYCNSPSHALRCPRRRLAGS